jgi:acetyltransferase
MRQFFYPESVVVFGVSGRSSNLARRMVENLVRFGFKGGIYAVGKNGGLVSGVEVLTDTDRLPEALDLAVLLIPAAQVPDTLEFCGRKGIRAVIIESGGFSELDDDNRALEARIIRTAAMWGIRFIGPNCFGVMNMENGLILPFFVLEPGYMKPGSISLISQSGGLFYDTCMLCSAENIGLNKLVSMGNKLALNENDFLEYMADDPGTRVIGMYLENFADGRRLMDLALSMDKPIVLLKANRGKGSTEIAKFHTTALAGDDGIADAAMLQAGVHRVANFREMIECFKIFSIPLVKGRHLALVTRSGGHGVLSADAVERHGFTLAEFPDALLNAIGERKANVIRATNPLDIGDVYDVDSYPQILEMMLTEKNVDGVVFIITYSSESDGIQIERFIKEAGRMMGFYGKPVVLCTVSNRDRWFAMKTAGDIPSFTDVDDALRALARSLNHYRCQKEKDGQKSRRAMQTERVIPSGPSTIMETDRAFGLLRNYDLPVSPFRVVHTLTDALDAARAIGYPVALKVASPHIPHKTEKGAVILDLKDPPELKAGLEGMDADTYLIQKMAEPGFEAIVGGIRDTEFGPVVLFGIGGIFVEVMKKTVMRVAPLDRRTAEEMIDTIEGTALLRGYRGKPAADIEGLVRILMKVSHLLVEHAEIKSIDINPVIVGENGRGCTIVDAKIEVAL